MKSFSMRKIPRGGWKEEQGTVSALKKFPAWFDVIGTNMYKNKKKGKGKLGKYQRQEIPEGV